MKKRPGYDRSDPCLCCGAMPTNTRTGLCRHCDDGGDLVDEDDDQDVCVHGRGFDEACEDCE